MKINFEKFGQKMDSLASELKIEITSLLPYNDIIHFAFTEKNHYRLLSLKELWLKAINNRTRLDKLLNDSLLGGWIEFAKILIINKGIIPTESATNLLLDACSESYGRCDFKLLKIILLHTPIKPKHLLLIRYSGVYGLICKSNNIEFINLMIKEYKLEIEFKDIVEHNQHLVNINFLKQVINNENILHRKNDIMELYQQFDNNKKIVKYIFKNYSLKRNDLEIIRTKHYKYLFKYYELTNKDYSKLIRSLLVDCSHDVFKWIKYILSLPNINPFEYNCNEIFYAAIDNAEILQLLINDSRFSVKDIDYDELLGDGIGLDVARYLVNNKIIDLFPIFEKDYYYIDELKQLALTDEDVIQRMTLIAGKCALRLIDYQNSIAVIPMGCINDKTANILKNLPSFDDECTYIDIGKVKIFCFSYLVEMRETLETIFDTQTKPLKLKSLRGLPPAVFNLRGKVGQFHTLSIHSYKSKQRCRACCKKSKIMYVNSRTGICSKCVKIAFAKLNPEYSRRELPVYNLGDICNLIGV